MSARPLRDRKFADSLLEGDGFEPPSSARIRETEPSSAELSRSASVLIKPHQRACVGERANLPKRVIAAAEPMRVLFAT